MASANPNPFFDITLASGPMSTSQPVTHNLESGPRTFIQTVISQLPPPVVSNQAGPLVTHRGCGPSTHIAPPATQGGSAPSTYIAPTIIHGGNAPATHTTPHTTLGGIVHPQWCHHKHPQPCRCIMHLQTPPPLWPRPTSTWGQIYHSWLV